MDIPKNCQNSVSFTSLHIPLRARKQDIVHPNDPVNNGKGGSNKGTDKVRHHRRSAKSSFSFLCFLLRFPGTRSINST